MLWFKRDANDQIYEEAFSSLKPEFQRAMFKNDKNNMKKVLGNIHEILFDGKKTIDKDEMSACIYLFNQVWIRKHGGFIPQNGDDLYIKDRLIERFPSFLPEKVEQAVDAATAYIHEVEPEIMKADHTRFALKKQIEEQAVQNAGIEKKHLEDPDWGLVPEKPVFVNGFSDINGYSREYGLGGDKYYLSHLRTESGEPVKIKRTGSITLSGICGPVDIYQVTMPNNEELNIYICNYGKSLTPVAPRGLTYAQDA